MTGWGLEAVEVRRGGEPALEDVNLAVPPGEITVVAGGDGAGKTTLCRLMVGLAVPSAGRVIRPRPEQVGYQAEASGTWRDLTVAENLGLVAAAHRLGDADRSGRIAELLEVTALGDARDRLVADLSGGMRQKLGVAMALVHQPELVVLDEPTTGLDPVSRTELWRLLAGAAGAGTAVLTTTTYVEEAERGSSVLVLDAGRELAAGTVSDAIASAPGVVAEIPADEPARFRWRRGSSWRAWYPDGDVPDGAVRVAPDLSDLVTVAAFARRQEVRA